MVNIGVLAIAAVLALRGDTAGASAGANTNANMNSISGSISTLLQGSHAQQPPPTRQCRTTDLANIFLLKLLNEGHTLLSDFPG
jgi:hypothetical protein